MPSGFGNHLSSEAVAGALPVGRNSPQKVPFGLYAEQLSGTAFTAPRSDNRRSWLYRLRPSAAHPPFAPAERAPLWRTPPLADSPPSPNRLRWDPLPLPQRPTDFVDGQVTYAAAGHWALGLGLAVGAWAANRSMTDAFFNADAEMLVVPQHGRLRIVTEFGLIDLAPLQVALIPRGVRVRVELADDSAGGYLCENFGAPFRLPELGPIGSNGLASPRDFEAPPAAFETDHRPTMLVQKYGGAFWSTRLGHSPFDVVAWHGNHWPWRYDLRRFTVLGSVSFDHPDPSIFTVLTSPSDSPGTANGDFVVFPPRWQVAEDSFRPPWFHRNVMSEFMGLIEGDYDAKAGGGFVAGGASLHNRLAAHGPDRTTYEAGVAAELAPHRLDRGTAFMVEGRLPFVPTRWALAAPQLQGDYDDCWTRFVPGEVP